MFISLRVPVDGVPTISGVHSSSDLATQSVESKFKHIGSCAIDLTPVEADQLVLCRVEGAVLVAKLASEAPEPIQYLENRVEVTHVPGSLWTWTSASTTKSLKLVATWSVVFVPDEEAVGDKTKILAKVLEAVLNPPSSTALGAYGKSLLDQISALGFKPKVAGPPASFGAVVGSSGSVAVETKTVVPSVVPSAAGSQLPPNPATVTEVTCYDKGVTTKLFEGQQIDVRCGISGKWYYGVLCKIHERKALVHYIDWQDRFNTWVPVTSDWICPLFTHTKPTPGYNQSGWPVPPCQALSVSAFLAANGVQPKPAAAAPPESTAPSINRAGFPPALPDFNKTG
jgi:hypothetical protein